MSIKDKLTNARETTWLLDALTEEDIVAAEFAAAIASSLQTQRKRLGLTQKELACRLGVSQVMISRWENGDENYTVATLAKLSTALGLKLYNPLISV
ncbi:hypothetical protein AGMMS49983_03430 [Clostridia bacterium]|nr:hypothetical protein AGMMS49983_03430 [Clostridia bacterium]